MNCSKITGIFGWAVMFVLIMTAGQVWAGAEDPRTTGTIEGPELWGVAVIDCSIKNVATLRVKRIVDCNVETQAVVQDWTSGCPTDASTPLYWQLTGVSLFGLTGTPIITKVKNFKMESGGVIYSFDAQIKFWQP